MNPDCLPVIREEDIKDLLLGDDTPFDLAQKRQQNETPANVNVCVLEDDENDETKEEDEEPVIAEVHRGTVDNPFLLDATEYALQKFILVNMFVAGKNATVQQGKLDLFIARAKQEMGEFAVNTMGVLSAIFHSYTADEMQDKISSWLKDVKTGQYGRLSAGIQQLASKIGHGKLHLKTCAREKLVGIKGIGYKTASMFLMYTRKNWRGACLDTHILKYMREEAKLPNIPISTPSLKSDYINIEGMFISIADQLRKDVANLDFEIWSKYRVKPSSNP
jgi:thermostable 8-oxoguanine DNA glycosylase